MTNGMESVLRRSAVAGVLAVVAVSSGGAHADSGKQRRTAQALAGVGTGLSSGLIVASLFVKNDREDVNQPMFVTGLATSVITPSLGQIYAGTYFTIGMGVRAISAGVAWYAINNFTATKRCNAGTEMCEHITQTGLLTTGLAAIGYIGGIAWDIYDTPDAVDRYNRKHGVYVSGGMSAARTTDGHTVPLVGLSGSF